MFGLPKIAVYAIAAGIALAAIGGVFLYVQNLGARLERAKVDREVLIETQRQTTVANAALDAARRREEAAQIELQSLRSLADEFESAAETDSSCLRIIDERTHEQLERIR